MNSFNKQSQNGFWEITRRLKEKKEEGKTKERIGGVGGERIVLVKGHWC